MAEKEVKYITTTAFVDLQDDGKEYEEDKPFPRPANKKIPKKRIDELLSSDNKLGKPVIKEIRE